MKQSFNLKLGTSLAMTPQLQQAIRLLQLSSLELEQEIQQQLENNPLLELVDPNDTDMSDQEFISANLSSSVSTDHVDEAPDVASIQLDDQMQLSNMTDDLQVDVQWDDIYNEKISSQSPSDMDEPEDNRTGHQSLNDHLLWQLNTGLFSDIDKLVGLFIIDAIDERGFLVVDLDELHMGLQQHLENLFLEQSDWLDDDTSIEFDEVEMVLKRIQQFEPTGVGARNLEECLYLQLQALPPDTPQRNDAMTLLKHHQFLVANDMPNLMRHTKLGEADLKRALTVLQSLETSPGRRFQDINKDYQTPDVVVRKKNGHWEVVLNTDILPRLKVNPYYASMIQRNDKGADSEYLKQNLSDAKTFIKSVDERHKTLLRVSDCIVRYQLHFFEHGPEAMKPMIMREIAEELELHESTISRITTQKFMLTPRGLYELKYFFSSHVGTSTGGECSSTAITAMIKKMIQEENPRKPLSDQVMAERLQQEGIDIARRTVAKYRESLNISSSSERKRLL